MPLLLSLMPLSGVQVGTEKAIELLEKANIPAFIVVNKMDREKRHLCQGHGRIKRNLWQ